MKDSEVSIPDLEWQVFSHGGKRSTGKNVYDWCKEIESLGAGEILLTSIDSDGSKDGFDIMLNQTISKLIKIPLIASGGGGKLNHFSDVLEKGKADAVLAASIFHFNIYTVNDLKLYLKKQRINVRDVTK